MGLFVTVEGIDGSGKTTLARSLGQALTDNGIDAVFLDRKYTNYDSSYLANFVNGLKTVLWDRSPNQPVTEVGDAGWYYLHASWYAIFAKNALQQHLEQYEVVIMDGWFYKIKARFLAKELYLADALEAPFRELPKEDIGIYLDISPQLASERKLTFTDAESGANEGYASGRKESFVAYQYRVKSHYDAIAYRNKWNIVDASRDIDTVTSEVIPLIIQSVLS